MEKILLFDGAFGTYYKERFGGDIPAAEANTAAPERVLSIHSEYIKAGAGAIRTNTFAVNSAAYPSESVRRELAAAGYALAVKAAGGGNVLVFADIGTLPLDSYGDAKNSYLREAELFLGLGAGCFLFETLPDFDTVIPAVEYIRDRRPDALIMVTFAVSSDGYTALGLHAPELLLRADRHGADIVGYNCVCGPSAMAALVKAAPPLRARLAALPNSGFPSFAGGEAKYSDNPGYFSEKAALLAYSGATVIGGCCGTKPRHIELTGQALLRRGGTPEPSVTASVLRKNANADNRQATSPFLSEMNGSFAAVELDPPMSTDFSEIGEAARTLADAGADMLTASDSPLARARADSFMTSAILSRETGLPCMPHLACRDKNRLGIHGLLLAGAYEKLPGALIVTGDAAHGEDADRGVFSFNSVSLMKYAASLKDEGVLPRQFLTAGGLNVNAANFEKELMRAKKKTAAGCSFFVTQAIFCKSAAEALGRAYSELGVPVLAGVMPLAGYKNALFLSREVAGIDIPEEVIRSLEGKSREEMTEISLAYARSIVDMCRGRCSGFCVMPSRGRTDLAAALIKYIKKPKGDTL